MHWAVTAVDEGTGVIKNVDWAPTCVRKIKKRSAVVTNNISNGTSVNVRNFEHISNFNIENCRWIDTAAQDFRRSANKMS